MRIYSNSSDIKRGHSCRSDGRYWSGSWGRSLQPAAGWQTALIGNWRTASHSCLEWLSPRNSVTLDKLMVAGLLPTFHKISKFSVLFTNDGRSTLTRNTYTITYALTHSLLKSILILSLNLRLSLPSGHFVSVSQTKGLYALSNFPNVLRAAPI
jgi:hypothetical protein